MKSSSTAQFYHGFGKELESHCNFSQSEVNCLSLSDIQREADERYETFYQCIVAHSEDNLLSVVSGLQHDGAVATKDQVMSPTIEKLAVYL